MADCFVAPSQRTLQVRRRRPAVYPAQIRAPQHVQLLMHKSINSSLRGSDNNRVNLKRYQNRIVLYECFRVKIFPKTFNPNSPVACGIRPIAELSAQGAPEALLRQKTDPLVVTKKFDHTFKYALTPPPPRHECRGGGGVTFLFSPKGHFSDRRLWRIRCRELCDRRVSVLLCECQESTRMIPSFLPPSFSLFFNYPQQLVLRLYYGCRLS